MSLLKCNDINKLILWIYMFSSYCVLIPLDSDIFNAQANIFAKIMEFCTYIPPKEYPLPA